jgi:hypothetical protein
MPKLEEVASFFKQPTHAKAEDVNKLKNAGIDTTVFKPVIDARRNMVPYETQLNVHLDDIGKVYGKCCLFPGKCGVAELSFLTTADDIARSKADFDLILSSFTFETGYGYEAGLVPEVPNRGFYYSRMVMAALITGLLAPLCHRLLKWRCPNSPPRVLSLRVVFAILIVLGGLEFLIDRAGEPFGLAFAFGAVAVGIMALALSWILEVRKPTPKESPPGRSPA